MLSWRTFGGHLGASWAPLATFWVQLRRSFKNWGNLLWALRSKYALKTLPDPPEVPKRPPETLQRSAERPQSPPKSSQKNSKCIPRLWFINILNICNLYIRHRFYYNLCHSQNYPYLYLHAHPHSLFTKYDYGSLCNISLLLEMHDYQTRLGGMRVVCSNETIRMRQREEDEEGQET